MSGIKLITLPIGNNKDLTFRAKEELELANIIYAEDTRVFREFCKHNGISLESKKIDSFHDHTDERKLSRIVSLMEDSTVCLVSDAGSPIISDPSFPLVLAAKESGFSIETIPGVSAVTAALELSALAPSPFHFYSFIPRDKGKKNAFYEECKSVYGTHIFFEGVSRVEKTVGELTKIFPDSDFCIAREITKTHESVHRFKGSEWDEIKTQITYKGEFVVLFHNNSKSNTSNTKLIELAEEILESGAAPKKISKLIAMITDKNSKDIYQKLQKK